MDDFAKSIGAIPRTQEQDDEFAKSIGAVAKTADQPLPSEDPSRTESFLRGGAQGLTFGLADELAGAMSNPIGAAQQVGEYLHLSDANSPAAEEYRAARDESRKAYEEAEKAHGGFNLVGNLTGALLPALLTLGGSSAATGAALAPEAAELAGAGVKSAGLFTKILQGAKAGAGAGTAFGVGQDTGNQLSARDIIRNAAVGGVTGAALPVAGKAIGGTHNLLKNKSTTYEELARIMDKTASGAKILGSEAKEKLFGKAKEEAEDITSGIAKARGKIGADIAKAKELEPVKDISNVTKTLESGMTGMGKDIPVQSKIAPKVDEIVSKIEDHTNKSNLRLSERTNKIQDLKDKLENIRAEKSKAQELFNQEKSNRIVSELENSNKTIAEKTKADLAKLTENKAKLETKLQEESTGFPVAGESESLAKLNKVNELITQKQAAAEQAITENQAKLEGLKSGQILPEQLDTNNYKVKTAGKQLGYLEGEEKYLTGEIERHQAALETESTKTQETLQKLNSKKDSLVKAMQNEPKTTKQYYSPEVEQDVGRIQDVLSRFSEDELQNASPETVKTILDTLRDYSATGTAPMKSTQGMGKVLDAISKIKGMDSEALTNLKQKFTNIASADEALTGKASKYTVNQQQAADNAVFKKLLQSSKDNETASFRNLQLKDQADKLRAAGQEDLANRVEGFSKGVGQDYIDAMRVNPKNLHENLIPKVGALVGESAHAVKQLPGQAIDKILDNKFAGPVLKKLDEVALQNKYSQTVIDTVKKNMSLQDQNKRKAAINIMMQSPTYRELMKELGLAIGKMTGVADGESTK